MIKQDNKYPRARRKIRWPFAIVFLFVFVRQAMLMMVSLVFINIEAILAAKGSVWYFIAFLSSLLFFATLLDYLIEKLLFRIHYRYEYFYTPMLYDRLFHSKIQSYSAHANSIFTRYAILRDITEIRNANLQGVSKIMIELTTLPVWLGFAFWLNVDLGMFLGLIMVLMLGLLFLNFRLSRGGQVRAENTARASLDKLEIIRNSGKTILSMGLYAHMKQVWILLRMRELFFHVKQASQIALFQNFIRLVYLLSIILLPIFVLDPQQAQANYGFVLAVFWLGFFALRPIIDSGALLRVWLKANIRKPEINQKLQEPMAGGNYWQAETNGRLQLKNVKVSTAKSVDPILEVEDLEIGSGQLLGVIGNIGSGKSVFCRLLAGIETYQGTMLFDGTPYQDWDPELLGHHIGYLPQEIDLLPGTVAENICRFTVKAREDDIVSVAQLAGAAAHIEALERSYATEIAIGDDTVPYGLKQRIAIARAFYGLPQVIILDAPTAQLDQRALKDLRASIEQLKKMGKTIILVTHLRQFLELADKIAIFHEHRLAACDDAQKIIANM